MSYQAFVRMQTLILVALLALECVPLAQAQSATPVSAPPGFGCPADHTPCYLDDGTPGNCKPLVNCAYYWGTKARFENCSAAPPACTMGSGYQGVCCPEVLPGGDPKPDIVHEPDPPVNDVDVTPEQIKYCIEQAKSNLTHFQDDQIYERRYNDPSNFKTGISVDYYNSEFKYISECAYFATAVGCCLQYIVPGYNPLGEGSLVRLVDYPDDLPAYCRSVCNATDASKVICKRQEKATDRTITGECNSFGFGNAYFGTYTSCRKRFIQPEYEDRCYALKKGGPRHPRAVRTCALPDAKVADCGVSQLLTDFGQFVVHDVAHGHTWQGSHSGSNLDCCFGTDGFPSGIPPNPKCGYINVQGDPFYDKCQVVDCLNLPRVALSPNEGCGAGAAHQINSVTHYLDLSQVYGSEYKTAAALRTFKDGRLNTSNGDCCDQQLPISPNQEGCALKACGQCKLCGDVRCNEQPGLQLFHLLFVRFHNYCTFKLKQVNPHWSDEDLYKNCKAINIFIWQHIIYNEYLPILLGFETTSKFGVMGDTCSYTYDYDPAETAQTREEWACAAGRLHTTISGVINMKNSCYQTVKTDRLVDHYNDPTFLAKKDSVDNFLRGRLSTCQAGLDKYFDCQVSSCLLKERTTYGLDIAAININRDKDCALSPYYKAWPLCKRGKNLTSWDDLIGVMNDDDIACLKGTYETVYDLPLYIGMLYELKTDCDSLMGPTMACITAQQFKYWRIADYLFYSNSNLGSEAILTEIRKTSLAYLLCETSCIKCVNTFPFRVPGDRNPLICCGDNKKLPKMDWNVFREVPSSPSPVSSPAA